eukprot:scaffold4029_cov117-Isochrysis_galbana.AAC.2
MAAGGRDTGRTTDHHTTWPTEPDARFMGVAVAEGPLCRKAAPRHHGPTAALSLSHSSGYGRMPAGYLRAARRFSHTSILSMHGTGGTILSADISGSASLSSSTAQRQRPHS